jgi:hypothetical protein
LGSTRVVVETPTPPPLSLAEAVALANISIALRRLIGQQVARGGGLTLDKAWKAGVDREDILALLQAGVE